MFAGPAGTGKTTSALALAKEIFGDNWRNNFVELNASDERGIDVVRGKIKEFARTAPIGGASFKIIFLDEADALTGDAQAALRRTMEKYSAICRFILSCNYSSKIIEPIQSRCAVFRFRPLKEKDIKQYLTRIAKAEKIDLTDDAADALVHVASGDMRKAVNSLQVAASLGDKVTIDVVYQTTGNGQAGGGQEAARDRAGRGFRGGPQPAGRDHDQLWTVRRGHHQADPQRHLRA